jgi:hypothetical protein
VAVAAGHAPGLDGLEPEQAALEIGDRAPEAAEPGIERLVLRVRRMVVAAVRVGLPELKEA